MKEKIGILLDVARGLGYLHTQTPPVIHCDLYPNNIQLKRLPASSVDCLWVAKLADMGVINPDARKLGRLTKAPGTADFMPHEVLPDNPVYNTVVHWMCFPLEESFYLYSHSNMAITNSVSHNGSCH